MIHPVLPFTVLSAVYFLFDAGAPPLVSVGTVAFCCALYMFFASLEDDDS